MKHHWIQGASVTLLLVAATAQTAACSSNVVPSPTPTPTGPMGDRDRDGFTDCEISNKKTVPCDCDDHNSAAYPDAPEINDTVDNDCDGVVEFIANVTAGGGREALYSITSTKDGGLAAAGSTVRDVDYYSDVWLIKVDSKGETQWSKWFHFGGNEIAKAITTHSDGGFVVVGTNQLPGAQHTDALVLMVDENGSEVWNRTLAEDNTLKGTTAAAVLVAHEIVVVGTTYDGNDNNVTLWSLDSFGTVTWKLELGGSSADEYGTGISLSPDGSLLVSVATYGKEEEDAVLVYQVSDLGVIQKTLSSASAVPATSITKTDHGALLVTTDYSGYLGGSALLSFSPDMTPNWTVLVPESTSNTSVSQAVSTLSYIVCGSEDIYEYGYTPTSINGRITSIEISGAINWSKRYIVDDLGYNHGIVFHDLAIMPTGGIALAAEIGLRGSLLMTDHNGLIPQGAGITLEQIPSDVGGARTNDK